MSIWLFTLIHSFIFCEYRVYLLDIKLNDDKTILVSSTLDHVQFPNIFNGSKAKKITIIDSWMCYGDTSGFKKHCSKPITDNNEGKN